MNIFAATTFSDIFKSNFLEKVTSVSPLDMGIAILMSLAIGLFIFLVYKKTFQGVMYSAGFGVSLIAMCMITTFVILAVTSNVVLSLGMVGALSIVRFRTAIKEPLDICFMFWSIAAGIVVGAGLLLLAVAGSIVIGILLLVLVNKKSKDNPYILIVHCENDAAEQAACEVVKERGKKYVIKSKCVSANGVELTMELRLSEMTTEFVNVISGLDGVRDASLVSYNGDYMS